VNSAFARHCFMPRKFFCFKVGVTVSLKVCELRVPLCYVCR